MSRRSRPTPTGEGTRQTGRPQEEESGASLDLDIDVETMPPRPVGSPIDMRERLTLRLKTTDPATLAAAENDYRGVWSSEHAYIVEQVAEHLPPFLGWLAAAADPAQLREGYQGKALRVWSIPLELGKVMVFESYTDTLQSGALATLEFPDMEPEAPCQVCGARDWMVTYWTDDARPQGCDRCTGTST